MNCDILIHIFLILSYFCISHNEKEYRERLEKLEMRLEELEDYHHDI